MSNLTDKLEQPQQEPVAWMSDDDIDRICDELSLGARGRASFRAGLRYARDIARQAHSRTAEPIAWWNPVNDVALCKSEIERRNGDKGACSIPLYSRPTDLLMTANYAQVSSSATPKEGEELVRAAQAVVDRWDTPLWKDVPHTGEFIGKLREALSHYTTNP
jgi:hypothetical protein